MEGNLQKLVEDFGFPRCEAQMALNDSSGNLEVAIERLLSGEYKPPPYSDDMSSSSGPGPGTFEPERSSVYPSLKAEKQSPPAEEGLYPSLPTNPPPYSKAAIDTAMKSWELESAVNFLTCDELPWEKEDLRCSSCFNPVKEEKGKDRVVKDGVRIYHYHCYIKSRGPKCSHCCFSLAKPDQDRELSGQYLIYEGKNYHVECYEKYAGPRCSMCFNVIIERPSGDYTGKWTQDGMKMYHEECYYRKQYADYRARMS